jgi:hypothetical protein
VLDDAVNRLPAKYRVPFVLCYLEGLTQAQAARQMGCPEGTVATRLARARQRLRSRLVKQGLGVAAGVMALSVWSKAASATLPALLLVSTLRIATVFRLGKTPLPADFPVKVAALTKGVSRAMFLTKLRFALITSVLVVATVGGTGIWTFGAFASEPGPQAPPPPERVQPPPPVAAPPVVRGQVPIPVTAPAAENEETSAVVYSENFEVHTTTRRIAQLVAEAAERFRKSKATHWLGKELPAWSERCPLHVVITTNGSGGATTFAFDDGKVKSREMRLEGSLDRILASVLPHEVTHTILAEHFRAPVPRWADEGCAVLAEDMDEQLRHQALLPKMMKDNRLIPLSRLVRMKSYPQDVTVLFTEGYSLTRFLVEKKDRKTFLEFVAQGMKDDTWNKAVKKYYDFDDMDALEDAWLTHVKKEAKETPPPDVSKRPAISSAAPTIGRARTDADGFLTLRYPVASFEPKTVYMPPGTGNGPQTQVTRHELNVAEQVVGLGPKEYEATDLKGKPLHRADLAKQLAEETPVLIALDGKKVDPYYLKVVKEGTIILIPTVKEAVPPPAPAIPELPPPPQRPSPVPH